jgi:hypothetical protein
MGFVPQPVASDGESWLTGWGARIPITLTGWEPTGPDYQVLITVTKRAFMQADFDDIRFTDSDGITLLDYWLEEKVDSNYAVFWVEEDDALDWGTQEVLYLYWGNDEASSLSNGKQTFLLFDDFDDGSINTSIWDTYRSPSETGGEIVLNYGSNGEAIYSDDTFIYGRLKGSFYLGDPPTTYGGRMGFFDSLTGSKENDTSYWQTSPTSMSVYTDDEGGTDVDTIGDFGDAYHLYELCWTSTEVNYYIDDALEATHSNYVPDTENHAIVQAYRAGTTTKADWLFVGLCVATEPTISWGDVEGFDWNDVEEAILNLLVEDPTLVWGHDVFLVLAGLITIPLSTMYLAVNRKNMDTDKLLIFLIAFMVGLGLFIGGIMP